MTTTTDLAPLDTTDVDRWIGKPIGGGQLPDPISLNDIRRWVQGMYYPNPLHYDEGYAAQSVAGRIVAPASFAVANDVRMGATPAVQGSIPGSHMLFGGDEWWFFGPVIEAGDSIRMERLAFDYRVTNTRFAGPTMFQRGDTTYINQRGEIVARQRSTAIRYLVENARKLDSMRDQAAAPDWTEQQLEEIDGKRMAYYRTLTPHVRKCADDIKTGEQLPVRPIGPHTVASMTTEWRSYRYTVWGSYYYDGIPNSMEKAGWLPVMTRDQEALKVDPSKNDGLYVGASRGHVAPQFAELIGMPRPYGFGASMGAWVLDYVGGFVGELGKLVHSNIQYRFPPLLGDATYLNGSVTSIAPIEGAAVADVSFAIEMTNQDGRVMAQGSVEAQVPLQRP